MVVVTPPMPANMDPLHTESVKRRFLENLWQVQAKFRARAGQSVVLCSEEIEVDTRANRTTLARAYYNVYTRTAFLQEIKKVRFFKLCGGNWWCANCSKTKAVVHIDPEGTADPVPFGMNGPPYVRIRLQPIAGGLCRFGVGSSDPEDESEEDIVQLDRVPSRIVQTSKNFSIVGQLRLTFISTPVRTVHIQNGKQILDAGHSHVEVEILDFWAGRHLAELVQWSTWIHYGLLERHHLESQTYQVCDQPGIYHVRDNAHYNHSR